MTLEPALKFGAPSNFSTNFTIDDSKPALAGRRSSLSYVSLGTPHDASKIKIDCLTDLHTTKVLPGMYQGARYFLARLWETGAPKTMAAISFVDRQLRRVGLRMGRSASECTAGGMPTRCRRSAFWRNR